MTKDSLIFANDVLNEIIFDIDETIYNCKDANTVRRLEFVRNHLSLSVVQLAPIIFDSRKDTL